MAAVDTGSRVELTMSEAIARALAEPLERGEPMVVLGRDLGGSFGVVRALRERFGDEVVRDGPAGDAGLVGFGIGLACSGVRAVVELTSLDRAAEAADALANQAAKLHYASGGKLEVPLLVRAPMLASLGRGPEASQSLEAWFMHVPGLRVVVPSDAAEAHGLLRTALADRNPVLFLEDAGLYGRRAEVDLSSPAIPFGSARIVREGSDATVVALGRMVGEAVAAAQRLAARDVAVEVIDPRTLAPLDFSTILSSIGKTMRLAVAHDAARTGGAGAEIAALCLERGFTSLDAPVERVTAPDVPLPLGPSLSEVLPSADGIVAAVERLCRLETP